MRLIEKKCPNCGASLEFNEDDRSCKCDYCKRSFVIERDENNKKEYNLTATKVSDVIPTKIFLIPIFFIFIIVLISVLSINRAGIVGNSKLDDLNIITNTNYSIIDNEAESAIFNLTFGDNNYIRIGTSQRVKEYLLISDSKSVYIPVYKVTYTDWPNEENKFVLYIPVKFNDTTKSKGKLDTFNLGDGVIDADDYYFNLEHSSSTKGYQSIDELYEKYIKNYEKDYTIKTK